MSKTPITVLHKEAVGTISHMDVELWRVVADTPQALNYLVTIKENTAFGTRSVFSTRQIDHEEAQSLVTATPAFSKRGL